MPKRQARKRDNGSKLSGENWQNGKNGIWPRRNMRAITPSAKDEKYRLPDFRVDLILQQQDYIKS